MDVGHVGVILVHGPLEAGHAEVVDRLVEGEAADADGRAGGLPGDGHQPHDVPHQADAVEEALAGGDTGLGGLNPGILVGLGDQSHETAELARLAAEAVARVPVPHVLH